MDGYAFYHDDLSDMPLPVHGHIGAGIRSKAAPAGRHIVFLPAPMPDGPDSVAMEEFCSLDETAR